MTSFSGAAVKRITGWQYYTRKNACDLSARAGRGTFDAILARTCKTLGVITANAPCSLPLPGLCPGHAESSPVGIMGPRVDQISTQTRSTAITLQAGITPVITPRDSARRHRLCKMPNQSISEAECKRLAQVLEPKALPARISA